MAARPQVVEGRGEHLVKIDRPEIGLEGPGVQRAEVLEVGHQPAEAVHGAARLGDQRRRSSGVSAARCPAAASPSARSGLWRAVRGRARWSRRTARPGRGSRPGAGRPRRPALPGGGTRCRPRSGPRTSGARSCPPATRAPAGQRHGLADRHLQVGSAAFRRPFARAGHDVAAGGVPAAFQQVPAARPYIWRISSSRAGGSPCPRSPAAASRVSAAASALARLACARRERPGQRPGEGRPRLGRLRRG